MRERRLRRAERARRADAPAGRHAPTDTGPGARGVATTATAGCAGIATFITSAAPGRTCATGAGATGIATVDPGVCTVVGTGGFIETPNQRLPIKHVTTVMEPEDLAKVTYRLLEPENYAGAKVVVVGGGDSAVEAAIALGEAGAVVHLVYRRRVFDRIKIKNQKRLDAAVEANLVEVVLEASPRKISESQVEIKAGEETLRIDNDYVLIFAGGLLPTKLLEDAGVTIRRYHGEVYAPAN